jgi:uncharacterized phiE125 gp8 family phage protein
MEPRYKLKTAPAFEPVTIAQLKRNLHIEEDDHDRDEYLQEILDAVVDDVQTAIGRQLCRATYTGYLDDFPAAGVDLDLTLGPVDAITTVKYYNTSNVLTTMAAADYLLDNVALTGRLRFLNTYSVYTDRLNAVEIEFTNGWATAAAIPKEIKDIIILISTRRVLNPEDEQLNFGMGAKLTNSARLLKKYKVQRF